MIAFLQGILEESWPGRILVNVNGLGYEVIVPVTGEGEFGQAGQPVRILTHYQIRELEHTLYGFPNEESRSLFRLLIDRVSGVGPKVALSILSGMTTESFKKAVVAADFATISKVKGVGKKTAERIVLELRDKVGVKEAWETQASASVSPGERARNDAMLGLIALGFKQPDARKAVEQVPDTVMRTDEILRQALRYLQS